MPQTAFCKLIYLRRLRFLPLQVVDLTQNFAKLPGKSGYLPRIGRRVVNQGREDVTDGSQAVQTRLSGSYSQFRRGLAARFARSDKVRFRFAVLHRPQAA